MALLPTIGEHIVEGMDVEGLTKDLQEKSRVARLSRTFSRPGSPDVRPQQQLLDHDSRSDMGSSVVSSIPEDSPSIASTNLGDSTRSWVDEFSSASSHIEGSPDPSSLGNSLTDSGTGGSSRNESPSRAVSRLADVIGFGDRHEPQPSESSSSVVPTKTKAELWKEVKILSTSS